VAGSNDFKPIPITKGAQRDKDIDAMAHRVVQTYVAANPVEYRQGETFRTRGGARNCQSPRGWLRSRQ
jgi:hypothetical protein